MLTWQEPKLVRTVVREEFKRTVHRAILNRKLRLTKVPLTHELPNVQFRESLPIQQPRKANARKRLSMIDLMRGLG